jgi:Tfp pilus assembly protein PilN
MLRHNLATRPFYNTRLVAANILGLAVVVGLVTLFNVVQFTRLRASEATVGARAALAEQEASTLRTEAARVRAQIDSRDLETVATAAREANGLIDRRAFSWTELFSHLENTLPSDVRVTALQPRIDQGDQFVVGISVVARQIEDLDDFIEALEKTGAFQRALAVQEQTNEDGLIEAVVEATYAPAVAKEATARE